MILRIVSGPFGRLEDADLTRHLYWLKPGDAVRVGRSRFNADMVIDADQRMSAGHFSVSCEEDQCYVSDLDSTNGTFINGQRIEETRTLRDGDEIVAGTSRFAVEIIDPSRSSSSLEIDRFAAASYAEAGAGSHVSAVRAPTMQFSLEIVSGPGANLELESTLTVAQTWLQQDVPIKVGSSSAQADLAIAGDLEISPVHFTLQQREAICLLEVCEGCGTVRVNNLGIRQGELSGGERITVGRTTLLLRRETDQADPPTQVPPKQVAPPAAPSAEVELARNITALSSGHREQVVEALHWFQDTTPGELFREKACQKLSTFTRSGDQELRRLASICFARWSTARWQSTLLHFLDSGDPLVLSATFEALLRIGDQYGSNAIAQVLQDPQRREIACQAILNQHESAEKIGMRLLLHEDQQVQLAACRILEQVGTKPSELALLTRWQRSSGEEHELVRNAAQQALEAVRARL